MMNFARAFALGATLVLILSLKPARAAEPAAAEDGSGASKRTALEQQLSRRLTNARLSGFYELEGQKGPPRPDEYTLRSVRKDQGDKWIFTAVLSHRGTQLTLPLELPVLWAGDTPVITVTNFTIPTMGTYTARVMIYGDHYAGTWSAGRRTGYLWGRIAHENAAATTRPSVPAGD